MKMWSNAEDRMVDAKPGPGPAHYCRRCRTRYRCIGKWTRPTTPACPGCRLRRMEGQ